MPYPYLHARLLVVAAFSILALAHVTEAAPATLNPGDILVADRQGYIVKIDPVTGTQSILDTPGISFASGITMDANEQILVVSYDPNTFVVSIIRINPATGAQTIVTAGGYLNQYSGEPFNGIAVDDEGLILVPSRDVGGRAGVVQVDPVTGDQTILSMGSYLQIPRDITVVPKKLKK
jgi:streptogramin lyase